MKKYEIIVKVKDHTSAFSIIARDETSARNKAVKRAQFAENDKSLDCSVIQSCEYLGFYLNRRFFPANYVWMKKNK